MSRTSSKSGDALTAITIGKKSQKRDGSLSGTYDLKEKLLLSAVEEFGRKGYEAASTNDIVKNASVSKGLLFHYFGNKKNLFLECAVYVLIKLNNYMVENLDFTDRDIFSRIEKSLRIKLDFYREYPVLMGLAVNVWYSDNRRDIEERIIECTENYFEYSNKFLYENLDLGKLRKDFDYVKVIEYTSIMLDACWRRFSEKNGGDIERIAENIDSYMDEAGFVMELIKRGAYYGGT